MTAGCSAAVPSASDRTQISHDTSPEDFVDIRAAIGGDGEIGGALRRAKAAGKNAWIAPGRYILSGQVDITEMRIEATAEAYITAAGESGRMFFATGSIDPMPALMQDPTTSAAHLVFASDAMLRPFDWLILFNPTDFSWHASRPYYRAGEWCSVTSVKGQRVQLSKPLTTNYDAAKVQAFRIRPARAAIVGGNWDCDTKHLAYLSFCTGLLVAVKSLRARANTAIMLDRCAQAEARCDSGHNDGDGRDDYAICISNCYRVTVRGGSLYSRRHPVAIGGRDDLACVPNRECFVAGARLANDPASIVPCADIHGIAENCGYRDCEIAGGIALGGADPVYTHCTVSARADGNLAESSELVGGRIDLSNIRLRSPAVHVAGGRGLIDIGTQNLSFNASTRRDVMLVMTNFTLDAPRLAPHEAIVRVRNQGSAASLEIVLRNGTLHLGATPVELIRTSADQKAQIGGALTIANVTGLPSQSIIHVAEDGRYRDLPLHRN